LYHAAVLIRGISAAARLRWLLLSTVLVLAVVLGIVTESRDNDLWVPAFATLTALAFVAIGLSALAMRQRATILTVSRRERAFTVPPNPQRVFQAAAFTLIGGYIVCDKVGDVINRESLWPVDAALAAMWVLAAAAQWHLAGDRHGVRLRPDGVLNREPLGSLFIPWDAFVTANPVSPGSHRLTAYYQRPELVRRRGIGVSPDTLPAGIDPALLSRLVHEYVNHPERRAAIGSEPELHRVTAATGS
jgi:hypothetical protein